MFTTKVGPERLGDDFRDMLTDSLHRNVAQDSELRLLLATRTGVEEVGRLLEENFRAFFRLAVPKIISQLLIEADWYVDPTNGIGVYEFERTPQGDPPIPPYRMLHMVMDVRRQSPSRDGRPPGQQFAPAAAQAYGQVVRQLFGTEATMVTIETIDMAAIEKDLELIDLRRKKYARES